MSIVSRALVLELWKVASVVCRVFIVAQGSRGWSSLHSGGEDWVHSLGTIGVCVCVGVGVGLLTG